VTSPPRDAGTEEGGLPRIRPYLTAAPPPPELEVQPEVAAESDHDPRPRPFVLTAGRVGTHDPDIEMHTQVTARMFDPTATEFAVLPSEARAIVLLCAEPLSVAEISARLRLHLGVTKILVGDLRAAGLLDVHVLDHASSHDPETILRVIHGLRAFT
jgi:hypothetical protein